MEIKTIALKNHLRSEGCKVFMADAKAFDRDQKFRHYRQIETLKKYVLIEADRMNIEYYRINEKGKWELTAYSLEATTAKDTELEVNFPSVDFRCPISLMFFPKSRTMPNILADLNPKIQQRLGFSLIEISAFCQQWQIVEMALFGSVLREDFEVDSDIDILVKFSPKARQGLLTIAQIKHELEMRLKRPVDIAIKQSIETSENWIRRHEILETAQVIYEQG
jgi:predicted nucleotidyltransferase